MSHRTSATNLLRALNPLKPKRFTTLHPGPGLHFQAEEAARCLELGLTESPIMPLGQSMDVLRTIDLAREQIRRSA